MPLLLLINTVALGAVLYYLTKIDKRLGGSATKGLEHMKNDLVQAVQAETARALSEANRIKETKVKETVRAVKKKVKTTTGAAVDAAAKKVDEATDAVEETLSEPSGMENH